MSSLPQVPARTYRVRTYGCQMNVHDSERLSGLLEAAGYTAAPEGRDADVVVLNTCAVRENADNRLYGNLGHLRPVKDAHPGMQIAVGGCLAQKDQGLITTRAPWVPKTTSTHGARRTISPRSFCARQPPTAICMPGWASFTGRRWPRLP